VTSRSWVVLLLLGGLVAFAVMGGEYSTPAWLSLRREAGRERLRIEDLQREVDSLIRYARLVETDLATQERIARERHGMLKAGEHAFILEERPDREP
jgi:cell division protein FtsB